MWWAAGRRRIFRFRQAKNLLNSAITQYFLCVFAFKLDLDLPGVVSKGMFCSRCFWWLR